MAREPGTRQLRVDHREVEQATSHTSTEQSTPGQRALYELGMTGIPIVNVNNNCSTDRVTRRVLLRRTG